MLRCFEDDDVTHVEGRVDPLADAETIETELMLADLESLEKRLPALEKKVRGGDKDAKLAMALIERTLPVLRDGRPARMVEVSDDEAAAFRALNLLTTKPVLYVCNVDEDSASTGNALSDTVAEKARAENAEAIVISAKIESEIATLDPDERADYLETLGLDEPGLNRLIRTGYQLLDLITFFTAGPKEARAWTVPRETRAPKAAGAIHTDFEKGFIRAETITYDDYVALGGEQPAKDAGRMRLEGKDYVVQDGDVMPFRFAA